MNNKEITFNNGVSTINNIPQIKSDQLLTAWYAETVISRRHAYLWTTASPDSRSRHIKFTQARVSRFHSMRRSTISKSKNHARNYFPLRFGVKFDRNQFVLVTISARRAVSRLIYRRRDADRTFKCVFSIDKMQRARAVRTSSSYHRFVPHDCTECVISKVRRRHERQTISVP